LRKKLLFGTCCTAFCLAVLIAGIRLRHTSIYFASTGAIEKVVPAPDFRAARPVVPFSVIPGGVRDPHELEASMVADRVVRAQYEHIRLRGLAVVRLERPTLMYASYRVGDQVYWTRHKLQLAEGELVLTDGVNTIRARCGNMLARELPLQRQAEPPSDPPPEVFEAGIPALRPVAVPEMAQTDEPLTTADVPDLPALDGPPPSYPHTLPLAPVASSPSYWPPVVVPPIYCCTKRQPPEQPPIHPAETPEPGTIVLLATGAAGWLAAKRRR
jgi:hypothetical protein